MPTRAENAVKAASTSSASACTTPKKTAKTTSTKVASKTGKCRSKTSKTNNQIGWREIKQPDEEDWITSGSLGSREAVLVFRARILHPRQKQTEEDLKSEGNPTDAADASADYNVAAAASSAGAKGIVSSKEMDTSFTANIDISKDIDCNLPSNITPPIDADDNLEGMDDEFLEEKRLHKRQFINKYQEANQYVCIIKADKRSGDSFSSVECSMSSEADDDELLEPIRRNDSINDVENNCYDEQQSAVNSCGNMEDEYTPEIGMPATELKITYKFHQTETMLLRKIFVRHGLTEADDDEHFSILWTGVHMKPDILRNLTPYQRVNHFPRSYELTRKDRLYKNIERMQYLRGYKYFDIVPQSFILPLEYRDLVTAHNKSRGPWIVKPAASSRGRGIFIVNTPDQIPQDEQVLVSKYISDPLCIDGHKCDLRVYVLVTSFDPLLIYMYEEGLVRLATVRYNLSADNLWNPCMHLCNYSINKYHSDYIKSRDAQHEDVGHKWTLSALLRHLKNQGCDTRLLMANIEDIIIKSILSSAQSIISACRMFVPNGSNCFELYGFDILIDATLKPWLLEVNLSPSMGVDSPLDAKVKASLITDLLTCVGIPAYTPTMRAHYDSKWTRFRSLNCPRRTCSAEPMPTGSGSGSSNSSSSGVSSIRRSNNNEKSNGKRLMPDELRIVRNTCLQYARRGGFVRIFPTEQTMGRYGSFLDPLTGIPITTTTVQGQSFQSAVVVHNYNQMLFDSLFDKQIKDDTAMQCNSFEKRMQQYERTIEALSPIYFARKRVEPKCEVRGKTLRRQILKLIDGGSELTQLQARQAFSLYLESILRRLTQEPRDYHEQIILKFLNRVGGCIKTPVFFRNAQNFRMVSKARSAMVAKLLYDFLEQYNRDTETYIDCFDHFGMIPTAIFLEYLSQAQEADLEAVLTRHTNLNGTMPYLYNRCGFSVPPTPPIPSGAHGFLKALPAMVQTGSVCRDFNKHEGYYKNLDKDVVHGRSTDNYLFNKKENSRR